jgi:hypothetical protein
MAPGTPTPPPFIVVTPDVIDLSSIHFFGLVIETLLYGTYFWCSSSFWRLALTITHTRHRHLPDARMDFVLDHERAPEGRQPGQ